MGLTPIEWSDLKAWIDLTGLEILPEECRILKNLSLIYISQLNSSKKQDAPAPYYDGFESVTKEQKCINIKEQMAQFRRKFKK